MLLDPLPCKVACSCMYLCDNVHCTMPECVMVWILLIISDETNHLEHFRVLQHSLIPCLAKLPAVVCICVTMYCTTFKCPTVWILSIVSDETNHLEPFRVLQNPSI